MVELQGNVGAAARRVASGVWITLLCAAAVCLHLTSSLAASSASVPSASSPAGPVATSVWEALDYDKDERTILSDVQDDSQWDTSALYVLLGRASMLPQTPDVLEQADRVNLQNLLARPALYRGRLIRMDVLHAGAEAIDHTETARRTLHWPYPRPVWESRVLIEVGSGGKKAYQHVIVLTCERPPARLNKYRPLAVAGLFYKLVPGESISDASKSQPIPIFVARQLLLPGPAPVSQGPWVARGLIFVVAVLLVTFIVLKRRADRSKKARRTSDYQPRRFEGGPDETAEVESDPEALDGELRRQVKQYLDEHPETERHDDGRDPQDSR